MRRYSLRENDQIYFLHIPKTGGMSLANTIYDYIPGDDRPQYLIEDLFDPPEALRKQRFIIGHTHFTIRHFLDREPIYITMLREPVAQVVSHFRHIQRIDTHDRHEQFRDLTLLEFLQTPTGIHHSSNFQTMSIAMDDDPRVHFKNGVPRNQVTVRMEEAVLARSDPQSLLEQVKARLQNFAFVGITDRFTDATSLLTYTFHWEPFPRVLHFNFDPERPTDIPAEARELITERSPQDFELYKFGCELFETRRRDMIYDLLETDHQYRVPEMTEASQSHGASTAELPHDSIQYANDNRGWSDGWAGPRWVLSGMALPVSMKNLELRGKTFPHVFKTPLKLTVLVGGKPNQQIQVEKDGTFSLTVPLSRAPIEILADQYFIPAQLGTSADKRPLSWLIEAMNLT